MRPPRPPADGLITRPPSPPAGRPIRRRDLLAGSIAALAGSALPLKLHAAAAAAGDGLAGSGNDYRALVCLFLFGGNDSGNTLIPFDQPEYDRYVIAREGSLARPFGITRLRSELLPLSATGLGGRVYALPNDMATLKGLYDAGRAAVIGNIGLLAQPTTRAQYESGSVEVPPQLFSHSDQATFWQGGVPSYSNATGWGGRIVDLLASANQGGRVSAAVSLGGTNLWQVGTDVIPFPLDPVGGATRLSALNDADYGPAFQAMLNAPRTNRLEQELVRVYRRSIDGEQAVTEALAATAGIDALFDRNPPPGVPSGAGGWHRDLMGRLAMVARMIAAREQLQIRRQVFFVSIGGFDMHSSLADHRYALRAISDGLARFHQVLDQRGFGSSVVSFTASDFGRPLRTNGTGSDHGWGSHQFVVGGAVAGGNIYGTLPTLDLGGQQYTGPQGTLIPTTSLEQLVAALARWMGVSPGNLPLVVPNLGRFGPMLPLFP
jgi:uncharacterized protein (DUF1501 family)